MNCAKYLQECARDPLRANRCPACNAVELFPAECRRRLYFATSPYPHLELNKEGTSYLMRPPDATLVPTRAPSPTGSCRRTCSTESSSS